MNVPRPFFILLGTLCVRLPLPEGGWRKATPADQAECDALIEREKQTLARRQVTTVTK